MAVDSKVDFLREVEKTLSDTVTVAEMAKIMEAISGVMDGYDMRRVTAWADEKDDLLECYLSALSVECRSKKTIERYKYIISRMMKFVNVPTRRITVYHLRTYLHSEQERGVADTTLESTRQVFSAYFNWLQRESLIDKNPVANLGTIKCAKKEKKTYSGAEIERLMQKCDLRDKAIVQFLYSTGCRISEMTELDRDAVDLEKLECVVHGKGNKERRVYLSEVAGLLLQQYLDTRKDANPALFVGKGAKRLFPGGVRIMLNRIAEQAHVEHVHPHKFRRTRATELARKGMPIQEVARVLGHEKIDTTMRYVISCDDDIKHNYRRYA